jgi:hypothetical protein
LRKQALQGRPKIPPLKVPLDTAAMALIPPRATLHIIERAAQQKHHNARNDSEGESNKRKKEKETKKKKK